MLKIKNEGFFYDSGQHAWQVTQTLKFGCLSLKPDRNMEITIYIRSKSESDNGTGEQFCSV